MKIQWWNGGIASSFLTLALDGRLDSIDRSKPHAPTSNQTPIPQSTIPLSNRYTD
jgi:hypothetical protein